MVDEVSFASEGSQMKHTPSILTLFLLALLCLGEGLSQAGIVLVTSRTNQFANDYVDWGTLNVPNGAQVNSPLTINTAILMQVTATSNLGPFNFFQQSGAGGGPWDGNFTPGDNLLHSGFGSSSTTIDFSSLVFGAGANINVNTNANSTNFVARIRAFDAANVQLATFTINGTTTDANDGSAPFIGILSDDANIARVVFSVDSSNQAGFLDFAINQLAITAIPEPSSCCLVLAAGLGMLHRFRRKEAIK